MILFLLTFFIKKVLSTFCLVTLEFIFSIMPLENED